MSNDSVDDVQANESCNNKRDVDDNFDSHTVNVVECNVAGAGCFVLGDGHDCGHRDVRGDLGADRVVKSTGNWFSVSKLM